MFALAVQISLSSCSSRIACAGLKQTSSRGLTLNWSASVSSATNPKFPYKPRDCAVLRKCQTYAAGCTVEDEDAVDGFLVKSMPKRFILATKITVMMHSAVSFCSLYLTIGCTNASTQMVVYAFVLCRNTASGGIMY